MDGEGAPRGFQFSPILIGVLGIMAGSILIATYHFISLGRCGGRCYNRQASNNEPTNTRQDIERNDNNEEEWQRGRIRSSSVMRVLMPALRYSKDRNKEDTCAVCLGEFMDGEKVRELPECFHLFHVPCIDMWLGSHFNCPLCRANAAAPPHLLLALPDSGGAPPPELHREANFVV